MNNVAVTQQRKRASTEANEQSKISFGKALEKLGGQPAFKKL